MSVQSINTIPIRKAYNEINIKINDLNRQVRNYNIKTIFKVALFYFGLTAACFSVAGIATAGIIWSAKEIAVLSFTLGIAFVGSLRMDTLVNRAMSKTQKEFLSKMNDELKKAINSDDINRSLFGLKIINEKKYINLPAFRPSYKFTVNKIKLNSYENVENRYLKIKLEYFQKISDDNQKELEDLRKWLENHLKKIEDLKKDFKNVNLFYYILPPFLRRALKIQTDF